MYVRVSILPITHIHIRVRVLLRYRYNHTHRPTGNHRAGAGVDVRCIYLCNVPTRYKGYVEDTIHIPPKHMHHKKMRGVTIPVPVVPRQFHSLVYLVHAGVSMHTTFQHTPTRYILTHYTLMVLRVLLSEVQFNYLIFNFVFCTKYKVLVQYVYLDTL